MTPAPNRRWYHISLRTFLFAVIPYMAFMVWVWSWKPVPRPEPYLWADQFGKRLSDGIFRVVQVEVAVLATLVFVAVLTVPKIVRWIARRRRDRGVVKPG